MPQLDFRDHIRRLPHLTTVSFANLVIEVGYVFLVCFLTFRYGGTQVDAISVLEFVTACIFLGFIARSYLTHTWQVVNTKIWLFLGLFFAYIALLVTPLPSGLIKYLSPNARLVCDSFLPQGGLWVMRSGMRSLAVYSYAAIFELRLLCSYGILFYVAVNFFTNWHTIRRLFKVMLSLAFIIALFGISQGYHPTGKIYWFQDWSQAGNFFGPYINKNHFAGHMLLVIPYFLVMVIFAKMLEQRILAAFTAVMVIIALCMSLSRGGIISSVFMIAIFFAFLGAKNIRSKKIWVLGSVFCVALFFLGYIGMGPIRGRFLKFFALLGIIG